MSERNSEIARERHDAPVVARTLCGWYHELTREGSGRDRAERGPAEKG